MKKIVCMRVCVCAKVEGQKNTNAQIDDFAIRFSSKQLLSIWGFRQSGFVGLGVQPVTSFQCSIFVQSGFEGLGVQPITSFQCPIFVQSDFEELGVQLIKVFQCSLFLQSGFEGLGFQPIRFGAAGVSINQVLRGWCPSQSHGFGVSPSSNQFFRARSSAKQVISIFRSSTIRFF